MGREVFYQKQVAKYIKNKNAKILVLGAGKLDQDIFKNLNYKNVKFTNIENSKEDNLDHFNNLHDIKLNDNSYDYCVAHACIHHSSKPHLAILELFRVCSEGSLIIEANDSLLSRLSCKLGFSEEYELSAIKKNIISGGVDNTNIPNYVYRWTEREVIKLMKSFRPELKHKIFFDYDYQIKFTNSKLINLLFSIFFMIFKKQKNLLSIYISKNKKNLEYNDWIK
ncbi:methyltransferase domain-containing protein [Candidatus Pelagibacter sp. HIMB1748]|uniref:methyltransferase domain-containing protein n=1 Tax=unclassified Candidatus Pelagibacter TaxID=2647897 RepID=UPI003F85ADC2